MGRDHNEPVAPGISFSRRRGEIVIFHSTVKALGEPCFIRFLLNTKKGRLAIQNCSEQTLESFVVPKYNANDWYFSIFSEPMLRIIWRRLGWERERTYRCFGVHYKQFDLVEFDLHNAEIISTGEKLRFVECEMPI